MSDPLLLHGSFLHSCHQRPSIGGHHFQANVIFGGDGPQITQGQPHRWSRGYSCWWKLQPVRQNGIRKQDCPQTSWVQSWRNSGQISPLANADFDSRGAQHVLDCLRPSGGSEGPGQFEVPVCERLEGLHLSFQNLHQVPVLPQVRILFCGFVQGTHRYSLWGNGATHKAKENLSNDL